MWLTFSLILSMLVFALRKSNRLRSESSEYSQAPQLQQRWWLFGFDIAHQFASWVRAKTSLSKSAVWIQENGRTFSVKIAGHTNIWTADASNARAILADAHQAFQLSHDRQVAFYPVVGNGMIAANGPNWVCGKKAISRGLTKDQVRCVSRYELHAQNLFKLLPVNGATVDMREYLLLFAMDTSTDILMEKSTYWLTKSTSDTVLKISGALDYCNQVMRLRGDLGFLVYFYWDAKFKRSCKLLHEFVEAYIDKGSGVTHNVKSRENLPNAIRPSFLKVLTSSVESRRLIRDHLLTGLMAGRDTTAALMGFTIWSLARDQRVQQRLRDEMSQFQMPIDCYESLRKATYLWWIIKEVLRLYPSIPANDRVATCDVELPHGGGHDGTKPIFVPRGRVIDIHIYAIHRDKEAWGQDAESFRPERWEGLANPVAFMPFGAGPRNCPGQELASVLTAFLVARMIQTYSWIESRDDEEFCEDVTISLSSFKGFQIALHT